MRYIAAAAAVLALGCSADPSPTCGVAGRVVVCACPGGAPGAQECGPEGVWTPCACPDAAPVDVVQPDAASDVLTLDGAPAPRLYTACRVGWDDCGPGLACLSPEGDAGVGAPGVCSVRCFDRDDCPGGITLAFLCTRGMCAVNCDRRMGPTDSVCAAGLRCVAVSASAGTIGGFRCLP